MVIALIIGILCGVTFAVIDNYIRSFI